VHGPLCGKSGIMPNAQSVNEEVNVKRSRPLLTSHGSRRGVEGSGWLIVVDRALHKPPVEQRGSFVAVFFPQRAPGDVMRAATRLDRKSFH